MPPRASSGLRSERQLVDTLGFKNQKQGLNSLTWNRPGSATGTYTFAVSALDQCRQVRQCQYAMTQGAVTGVNFHDGATYLSVGGQEIAFSDVVSVKQNEARMKMEIKAEETRRI